MDILKECKECISVVVVSTFTLFSHRWDQVGGILEAIAVILRNLGYVLLTILVTDYFGMSKDQGLIVAFFVGRWATEIDLVILNGLNSLTITNIINIIKKGR